MSKNEIATIHVWIFSTLERTIKVQLPEHPDEFCP